MKQPLPEISPSLVRFSPAARAIPIPNLIQVQKKSYDDFLQMDLLPAERKPQGLQAVFTSVFPFSNFKDTCALDFVHYGIGDWQCRCGSLKGLEHMRHVCPGCAHSIGIKKQEAQTVPAPNAVRPPNTIRRCANPAGTP